MSSILFSLSDCSNDYPVYQGLSTEAIAIILAKAIVLHKQEEYDSVILKVLKKIEKDGFILLIKYKN